MNCFSYNFFLIFNFQNLKIIYPKRKYVLFIFVLAKNIYNWISKNHGGTQIFSYIYIQ